MLVCTIIIIIIRGGGAFWPTAQLLIILNSNPYFLHMIHKLQAVMVECTLYPIGAISKYSKFLDNWCVWTRFIQQYCNSKSVEHFSIKISTKYLQFTHTHICTVHNDIMFDLNFFQAFSVLTWEAPESNIYDKSMVILGWACNKDHSAYILPGPELLHGFPVSIALVTTWIRCSQSGWDTGDGNSNIPSVASSARSQHPR